MEGVIFLSIIGIVISIIMIWKFFQISYDVRKIRLAVEDTAVSMCTVRRYFRKAQCCLYVGDKTGAKENALKARFYAENGMKDNSTPHRPFENAIEKINSFLEENNLL